MDVGDTCAQISASRSGGDGFGCAELSARGSRYDAFGCM